MMSSPTPPVDPMGDRLMAWFWWKPATTLAERTRRRVTVHLIPYLFFLYILAYLDRVNLSVAELDIHKPTNEGGLGLSHGTLGFAFGIFFWGYWILEVPSTVSVLRWGAKWVFVRILILWGICASLMGFIGTPFMAHLLGWLPHLSWGTEGWFASIAQFINELPENSTYQLYLFRFLLGFFEGGFFPSVILYLSLWFRPVDRGKAIACFMIAIPLSSALGNPISGTLLRADWFGLQGWRWIFILEGIVPVLAGFATIFFLPDRPHKAEWLATEERDWLTNELDAEHRSKQGHGHWAWIHHMGMVLLLTWVYFCLNVTSYGLSSFMPAILKSQLGIQSNTVASYVSTIPYLMSFLAMLIVGWHSDRTGERIWHVAIPLGSLGLAVYLAVLFDGFWIMPAIVMIFIVGTCMYSYLPAFWPIPTMFLGAATAASAIGFINMIGNLGGSVGPTLVGQSVAKQISWLDDRVTEGSGTRTADEERSLRDAISGVHTIAEAQKLWKEASVPGGGRPEEELNHLAEIAVESEKSGKLSADELQHLNQELTAVALRLDLDQESKTGAQGLFPLVSKGASFNSALLRIAPFPLMGALTVLAVSYFRKRVPVKNLQVT